MDLVETKRQDGRLISCARACMVERSNMPVNHHLFQVPDLEVLSDVSTYDAELVFSVQIICTVRVCVFVTKASVQKYLPTYLTDI